MEKELFNYFDSKEYLSLLSPLQIEKFKLSCKKSVLENPEADFNDLILACKIYLNFIINFPDLTL